MAGIPNDRTVLEDERELRGWLVVLSGQWRGKDYRLFAGKTVVGSSHYADVYLPDPGIEPYHFSIRFDVDNGEVWLTDLDSDSGLFLDEKRIRREKIPDETLFKASEIEFLVKILVL
jgi:pSer/pThr/pTyr-binding forkhead associated (FHA) protein